MSAFTFNETTCTTMEVSVKDIIRPILPQLNKTEISIPQKNGTWDFGNNTYENRVIRCVCYINEASLAAAQTKAKTVASWLSNKGNLILDDDPNVYYYCRAYNDISGKQIRNYIEFDVEFDCQPLAFGSSAKTKTVTV